MSTIFMKNWLYWWNFNFIYCNGKLWKPLFYALSFFPLLDFFLCTSFLYLHKTCDIYTCKKTQNILQSDFVYEMRQHVNMRRSTGKQLCNIRVVKSWKSVSFINTTTPAAPLLLNFPAPWGMRRVAKQTLTSCLLARKICGHAQREGRKKGERSTNDKETKCERQEREVSGALSFTPRRVTTSMTIKMSGSKEIQSKTRLGRMALRGVKAQQQQKQFNYENRSLWWKMN